MLLICTAKSVPICSEKDATLTPSDAKTKTLAQYIAFEAQKNASLRVQWNI